MSWGNAHPAIVSQPLDQRTCCAERTVGGRRGATGRPASSLSSTGSSLGSGSARIRFSATCTARQNLAWPSLPSREDAAPTSFAASEHRFPSQQAHRRHGPGSTPARSSLAHRGQARHPDRALRPVPSQDVRQCSDANGQCNWSLSRPDRRHDAQHRAKIAPPPHADQERQRG